MSNRRTSENSDSVSLFPFLAVLLCTMGALLILLVVFVERAAKQAAVAVVHESRSGTAAVSPHENTGQAELLQQQLAELTRYQAQLDPLRDEANRRLQDGQLRLSHSEEQVRQLEEELAKLAIAAMQLDQTEKKQNVDQVQAEAEMARLEKLVEETNDQVKSLREQPAGKHSYAIIPYKGPNGTYRKPIYLECTKKGITIHPEGIQLTEADFAVPRWPGNPLASALRASREYLNRQAASRGESEPLDPYPLLIVRPSGIDSYLLAREAITSWDSDFGYEFIGEDMKLSFPDAPDPQLAQVQQHALMISRDRLQQLALAAPSRFRGVSLGGGGTGGGGGNSAGYGGGDGSGSGDEFAAGVGGELAGATESAGGNTLRSGTGGAGSGSGSAAQGEKQFGNLANSGGADASLAGGTGENAGTAASDSAGGNSTSAGGGPDLGPRYAQVAGNSGGGQTGGTAGGDASMASAGGGQAGSDNNAAQFGAAPSGAASSDDPQANPNPSMMFTKQNDKPIAEARGANWAVQRAGPKSVAIRRTIHVVVRESQIAFLPGQGESVGPGTANHVIALDQSQDKIAKEFVATMQDQIEQWGLAGSGMYWRPVLELNVGPEAEMTAARLVHLLHNSGVEVQLPSTARASAPASAVQGGTVR